MTDPTSPSPDDLSSMPLPADLAAAGEAQAAADAGDHGAFAVEIAGAIIAGELAREAGADPLDALFGD